MKAPVFRDVGLPLVIEDIPDPTPRRNELVVKVARCGVCGSDLHATDGVGHTFPKGTVIGHEFAGEVTAIGLDVEGFRMGDRIAALPVVSCGRCVSCISGEPVWCERGSQFVGGGGAQYATVRSHAAIRLPATLSMADGALIEPFAAALHAVRLSSLKAGNRVLVLGAGPIGIATAFWAARGGASQVVVSSRSRRNESVALEFGATCFITMDQDRHGLNTSLGGAPDIIYECVGVPGMIAHAVELVRPRGLVVAVGSCLQPDMFTPLQLVVKQITVQGSIAYNTQEFEYVAEVLSRDDVGNRGLVTDVVSLEELPFAFEALRKPNTQCKVMISPWL